MLSVHNIQPDERIKIREENFPKSLSENDKTVIFLAGKLQAMILSSDKAVRKYAKEKAIEYHGMLWIFDKLIESKLLKHSDAIKKINKLVSENIVYQNNEELNAEVVKRKLSWANS